MSAAMRFPSATDSKPEPSRSHGKKTPLMSQLGWKLSRMTTAPSLRQPLMLSVQPITPTRSPRLNSCRVLLGIQVSDSVHIYRLDDGKLRLTFVHTSPDADGATFLSELGDFERPQAEEWLKDHLHPTTDFDALLKPLENQTELSVAVARILMQAHVEDGCLTKSPASVEDACVRLGDYQRQYFNSRKITPLLRLLATKT